MLWCDSEVVDRVATRVGNVIKHAETTEFAKTIMVDICTGILEVRIVD